MQKATDAEERISLLNLVEPTRKEADLELLTMNKKGEKTREFIKVFQGANKRQYYVLIVSEDKDNIFLTGIPISRLNKINKRIENAIEIKARDSVRISNVRSHNQPTTPNDNPTTNLQTSKDSLLNVDNDKDVSSSLSNDRDVSTSSQHDVK